MRIYVEHGEAYGNLGDEAMLFTALRKFELYFEKCEFIIPVERGKPFPELSGDFNIKLIETPRLFIARIIPRFLRRFPFFWGISVNLSSFIIKHGLLRYLFRDLHKWHSTLRSCDIFYSVGAANLTDFCLGPCVIYKCWIYRTAGDSVKISAIGPQGIGPLHTPWARKLICNAFSSVNFIALRDYKESYKLISNLITDNVEINITGDEAFSLPVADDESINTYLNIAGLSIDEKFVVINFRETDYTKNTKYLAPKIANILDCLVSKFKIKLLFIPMSYDVHSTNDIDYGLTIRNLTNNPSYMKIGALTTDTRLIKGVVGRGLFSFGLSYHIHVFSLSLGKPAIILYTGEYYKYKSEGLTGYYKFPVSSFDLDTSNLEHIIEAICEIMTNYNSITNDIVSINMMIYDINDWCYKKIKESVA
jgi:polysaccharide pyruvyl transferase WcaK-like protein